MKPIVMFFILSFILLNCKTTEECMTPPLGIYFKIMKNGLNVSKDYTSTLKIYYSDGSEHKNADLQFTDNVEFNGGYFYSHFPSLSTTEKRNFYLILGNDAKEYLIKVDIELIQKECNTYNLKNVYLNGQECNLDKSQLPNVYSFNI